MELFFKFGNQNNSTLEHEHKLNGLSVVESWIVEDRRKMTNLICINLDVPVGHLDAYPSKSKMRLFGLSG